MLEPDVSGRSGMTLNFGDTPSSPGQETSDAGPDASAGRRMRETLDALHVGVCVLDDEGRIRDVNAVALGRSGTTADTVTGVRFWQAPWWRHDPAQRDAAEHACSEASAGRESTVTLVADVNLSREPGTPAGDLLHVELSFVPLTGAGGEVRSVVVSGTDVTYFKQAEADARDAVAQRDDAIAVIGHELRNPLNGASMAYELLAARTDGLDEERQDLVGVFGRSLSLMRRLVDDLMDFNRLARGQVQLLVGDVDLRDVLDDALDDGNAGGPPVTSEFTGPGLVRGDRERLRQVVSNLLRNAAKATADVPDPRVAVCVSIGRDQTVVLDVSDNGKGFSPEHAEGLFQPFRGNTGGGLGLGLPLCREIVRAHGGAVTGRSGGTGRGATFRVILPAATPAVSTD